MMTLRELIKEIDSGGVRLNRRLKKALLKIDRAGFVLPGYGQEAYENQPLPIGFGQTISQPYTVAFMLELLNVRPGEKILEIGSGSGWQTALLAALTGEEGKVVAVERIKELSAMTAKNLSAYPEFGPACLVINGDGRHGYEPESPYDGIIAAASGEEIPAAWKAQVKIGGRIVTPVGESIIKLTKTGANEFAEEIYPGFVFVPLI